MLDHGIAQQALRTRLLTQVGLPAARAWDNEDYTPVPNTDYVREEYIPGPTVLVGLGSYAELEHRPQYVVTFCQTKNKGFATLEDYAAATMALFPPGQAITLSTGDVLRVMSVPGPFASGILYDGQGWAFKQVTIPLWARSANTI